MKRDRWLLPEGMEEILPPAARHAEKVRRELVDLLDHWGYELVMPPLIEYLESLLTGVGSELDLDTFKLTDQVTGRLMGVRADMTPQAARIDAHYLRRETPVRLCYVGPVARTRPDEFGTAREPLQIGAELFGAPGVRADSEVLRLMLALLARAGFGAVHVEMGHVGIYRGLARAAHLTPEAEQELFAALARRSAPDVTALLASWSLPEGIRDAMQALIRLHGSFSEFEAAERALAGAPESVRAALAEMKAVWQAVRGLCAEVEWHFDLAELNGYGYYTGVVFAAFVGHFGRAIAQGGRYDEIGGAFGRARPAVGFGADLRLLLKLSDQPAKGGGGVFAPYRENDPALRQAISALRDQGERVIEALSDTPDEAREMGCDRELRQQNGRWTVVARQ